MKIDWSNKIIFGWKCFLLSYEILWQSENKILTFDNLCIRRNWVWPEISKTKNGLFPTLSVATLSDFALNYTEQRKASLFSWSRHRPFLVSVNRDVLRNCSVNRDWGALRETWTAKILYTVHELACVASVSNRVIALKLERKRSFVPLPLPRHSFSFCSRSNFLDEPREETLSTQAIHEHWRWTEEIKSLIWPKEPSGSLI